MPDGTGAVVLHLCPGQRKLTISYGTEAEVGKVTGAGEDRLNDGLDSEAIEGAECGLWVRGVDYVAGWRGAREAADRLNRALLDAGFELSEVRAVAATDADGRGLVRVAGWPDAVDRLARALESADRGEGGAA